MANPTPPEDLAAFVKDEKAVANEIRWLTRIFVPGRYAEMTTDAEGQDDFYSGTREGWDRAGLAAIPKLLTLLATREAQLAAAKQKVAIAETALANVLNPAAAAEATLREVGELVEKYDRTNVYGTESKLAHELRRFLKSPNPQLKGEPT